MRDFLNLQNAKKNYYNFRIKLFYLVFIYIYKYNYLFIYVSSHLIMYLYIYLCIYIFLSIYLSIISINLFLPIKLNFAFISNHFYNYFIINLTSMNCSINIKSFSNSVKHSNLWIIKNVSFSSSHKKNYKIVYLMTTLTHVLMDIGHREN